MINLQEILNQSLSLVQQAAEIWLQYATNIQDLQIQTKSSDDMKTDGSPVTDADRAIEEFLIQWLADLIPGANMIWEETGTQDNDSEYTRIIDPIDGTREFARGTDDRSILVALQYWSEIVLGISHMPVIDEVVYATKWYWAYRNWKKIQVSDRPLAEAYIAHERRKYHQRDETYNQLKQLCDAVQYYKSDRLRAYHYLAQGKIEAFVAPKQSLYDMAPFVCIISEAGGRVTTLDWSPITQEFTDALYTNWVCHDDILTFFSD